MTNHEFAKTEKFKEVCGNAGVEPTRRQASKYRNGKGKAYAWVQRRS